MFKGYDTVKLSRDLPAHNLKAGTYGAIVMVHYEPDVAYEVELVDNEGDTLAVLTLKDADLNQVLPSEIAQMKQLVEV